MYQMYLYVNVVWMSNPEYILRIMYKIVVCHISQGQFIQITDFAKNKVG